jgi:cellulose synthase/poly-beta-1,6-N-acetylglucosamine synthase-like glycosyltransferase
MMRGMLEVLFWTGPIVTLYAYAAFPAFLVLLARLRGERHDAPSAAPAPAVTVIIPAYNEERHIEARIRNVLASDYPPELLDIVIVSDASTDGTNAIASRFVGDRVRLIVQEHRSGKTAGLNLAVRIATGEVMVFTDANAEYQADGIRRLTAPFADPKVGMVTGYTRYTLTASGEIGEATNAYTSLERLIKRTESLWGTCVGADGAIFAMRRSLFRPLRADDINDLVLPLTVIEQGFRCVLAEDAYCSERPGENLENEFRRQSRITNRSLRAIFRRRHLLNPFRHPAFAFFLWSHKVLRFLAPVAICLSLGALFPLAVVNRAYLVIAIGAAVAAGAVLAGRVMPRLLASDLQLARPLRLATVFVTMNVGMLHGWWKFLSGRTEVMWQPERMLSQ